MTRQAQSNPKTRALAPGLDEMTKARDFIASHYPRTPLYKSLGLTKRHGAEIFVKYENHGPTRSFKARNALYRLSLLDGGERRRGVVTVSTGNHGNGMAYAGARLGVPTTIVVPEGCPDIKLDNIRLLGSRLFIFGRDMDEAEARARRIALEEDRVFIEDGDDGGLMAGAGSIAWEILDELPEASAIVAPVGGGNLIAGMALVAKHHRSDIRIIGVQSEAAPSVYHSWREKRILSSHCRTRAGGLATSHPGVLAFTVLRDLVDSIMLVSEAELLGGIRTVLADTGQVAEHAGAAPFAALNALGAKPADGKIVLVLSGGNLSMEDLRAAVSS